MTDQTSNTTSADKNPLASPSPIPASPPPAIPPVGQIPPPALPHTPLPESAVRSRTMRPETRPHAFVVMPFGKKKGGDGSPYDFNAIYKDMIKPALEEAGFEPFRADEETSSGDILTDMFQELLLADLVLCDLSIDNANAFYELGIRHAFRKRGVMHIQAGRAYMPFDIFNVRTLPYHITPEGVPDPLYLKADIQAIARMAKDTWASDRDAIHSPIYNMLSGLKEPERNSLRTPLATGFWREYNEWKEKITIAQRQKRIGDILLLTEEISNPLLMEEAITEAGKALANLGRNELALAQYRKGLEIDPEDISFRREEAFHLNRLGRVDEAILKLENMIKDHPGDSETTSFLGKIYKEMWTKSWLEIKDGKKRLKTAFDSYHWLIKAVNIYLKGFHMDLNNYYPGVNALTLSYMALHLADQFENKKDPDPDITFIREKLPELRGALIFALETKAEEEPVDYWTLISLAELMVLTADNSSSVERAYRKALTASRQNLFNLNSSLKQLETIKALGLRKGFVDTGISTIRDEIARINTEEFGQMPPVNNGKQRKQARNGRAFMFTGYMVDHANKEKNTFPADKELEVREDIRKKLESFNLIPDDRAFVGGLSGGSEIIFAELCVAKGVKVKAFLPLPESDYIREFVAPAGDAWVERFYKIRNHPLVDEIYQFEHLGLPQKGESAYERNNRWTLYSSLGRGVERVHLIALWNGQREPSKDRDAHLVQHMVKLAREFGTAIEQINPSKYVYRFIDSVLDELIHEESQPNLRSAREKKTIKPRSSTTSVRKK